MDWCVCTIVCPFSAIELGCAKNMTGSLDSKKLRGLKLRISKGLSPTLMKLKKLFPIFRKLYRSSYRPSSLFGRTEAMVYQHSFTLRYIESLDDVPPRFYAPYIGKPPWSLYDTWMDGWSEYLLIGSDCPQKDCDYSELCTHPSTFFYSWTTFWNCLALCYIASTLGLDQSVSEDSAALEGMSEALRPLGLQPSYVDNFDWMTVMNLTFDCGQASCRGWTGDGERSLVYPDLDNPNLARDQYLTPVGAFQTTLYSDMCSGLPTVNMEIAGPGVSANYKIFLPPSSMSPQASNTHVEFIFSGLNPVADTNSGCNIVCNPDHTRHDDMDLLSLGVCHRVVELFHKVQCETSGLGFTERPPTLIARSQSQV